MKVISNLPQLMAEKRIKNISEISRETGISRITLTDLYENKEVSRIYATTITRLCEFFECEIGDLLIYEREGQADG